MLSGCLYLILSFSFNGLYTTNKSFVNPFEITILRSWVERVACSHRILELSKSTLLRLVQIASKLSPRTLKWEFWSIVTIIYSMSLTSIRTSYRHLWVDLMLWRRKFIRSITSILSTGMTPEILLIFGNLVNRLLIVLHD